MTENNEINVELEGVTVSPVISSSYNDLTNKPQINGIELSGNKTSAALGVQATLTAGENITIENNVISASGGMAEVAWGDITGDIEDQEDLTEALVEIKEIAEGKSKSYVVSAVTNPAFQITDETFTITGTITDIGGVEIDVEDLKVGDNVYVQESNYPDRWISAVAASGTTFVKLNSEQAPVTDVTWDGTSVVANNVAVLISKGLVKGYNATSIGYPNLNMVEIASLTTTSGATVFGASVNNGDIITDYANSIVRICTGHNATNPNYMQLTLINPADVNYSATSVRAQSGTAVAQAIAGKADASNVYTKIAVDTALALKANASDVYTESEIDTMLALKANVADVADKTTVYMLSSSGSDNVAFKSRALSLNVTTAVKVVSPTAKTIALTDLRVGDIFSFSASGQNFPDRICAYKSSAFATFYAIRTNVMDVLINGQTVINGSTGAAVIPLASTSTHGAMAKEDKTKLNGISPNANRTTVGTTTSSSTNEAKSITVDGTEYKIPEASADAVMYTAQSKTDSEKTQARTNIGAAAPTVIEFLGESD